MRARVATSAVVSATKSTMKRNATKKMILAPAKGSSVLA